MSQTNKCEFCNIEEVYPLYENKKIVKKGFLGNSTVKLISFCSYCAFYLQKNGYKNDYFVIYIDEYERIISELSPDLKKLTPCKYCESESNITRKLHCSICDTDYCGLCPSIYSQDVMSDLMCPHCLFKNFYTPITKLLKEIA